MNVLAFILGLILLLGCGYAIYYIIQLILTGAFQGNWFLLAAGGILAYLFIGLLIGGAILGILMMIWGAME